MKWFRVGLVVAFLGIAALVLTSVQGQQDGKKGKGGPGGGGGRGGFGGMTSYKAPLVSTDLSDKLKLTDEQKKAVSKLASEFEDKTKDSVEKVSAAMKEKNAESRKEAFEVIQTISKTRSEYQDKVKGLLKEEQKKTFEEEIKAQPGPGGRGGPGGPGGGGFGRAPANIFSTATQDKLGLSDEQKEKLASLKKEMDTKSLDVLTAEQKKKFEELKAAAPTRPGGGGGRPKQELNNND